MPPVTCPPKEELKVLMTSFPSFLDSPPSSPKFQDVSHDDFAEDFGALDSWMENMNNPNASTSSVATGNADDTKSPAFNLMTMDDIVLNGKDGDSSSILF